MADKVDYSDEVLEEVQALRVRNAVLEKSNRYFQLLFEHSPDAIVLIDPHAEDEDWPIVDCNTAFCKAHGLSRKVLIGKTIDIIHGAPEVPSVRAAYYKRLREEGTVTGETQHVHSDGEVFEVQYSTSLVELDGRELILGIDRDITQRKRLEQQLMERRRALHMIISAMPNVLMVVGENDQLESFFLPAHFPPLIKTPDADPKSHLSQVLPEDMVERTFETLAKVRQTGRACQFQQSITIDADEYSFTVKVSPVTETGEILVVIDDITDLKRAEDTIRQYAQELEISNDELRAYNSTVAHDLKSPLSIIVGYASLLADFPPETPVSAVQEPLEEVKNSALRMVKIIDSLLTFFTLKHAEETFEPVDMGSVVENVISQRLRLDIEKRGVEMEIQPDLPEAIGHAQWLEEVVANLLSNAIKYIGKENANPYIRICGVQLDDDYIRYEVTDNGIGITSENLDQLFEMFSRFHKNEAEGFGLGLPIVARIIGKLNGQLGVESEHGKGSTFWFSLPRAHQ